MGFTVPIGFHSNPTRRNIPMQPAGFKTFYVKNVATSDGGGTLQDGGTAPNAATTGTGWTPGTLAADQYAKMGYAVERDAGWFTGGVEPSGSPTAQECWISDAKLSGTFDAGDWDWAFPVIAVTARGSQDGRVRVRFWRVPNSDGSGAVEF